MIERILSILTLLMGGLAFADVPNTFQAGEAIKASEMNENFTAIDSEIEALDTRTENVSDLETKVANLEGQVETLQSLVNSVAETASTDVEFVGFSLPAVFGGLGLQAGRSVCSNSYAESQICSAHDIRGLNDWSSFTIDYPVFLTLREDGSDTNTNLCYNFSDRSGSISHGLIDGGKLFLKENTSSFGFSPVRYADAYSYVLSTFSPTNEVIGHNYEAGGENTYATETNYQPNRVQIYFCNVALPAACCK